MLEVRYRGQCLKFDSFKEVWARQWGVEDTEGGQAGGLSMCDTAESLGFTASGRQQDNQVVSKQYSPYRWLQAFR